MSNTDLIKELRALTQAGMKDCRDALEEAGWDLQKAVDVIKVKGQNIVSAREGKVASEGRAALIVEGGKIGAMVEVNCQTDFVANSESFQCFSATVALVLADATSNNETFNLEDVEAARQLQVTSTKENIVIRRWWVEQVAHPHARVFGYLHPNAKIGVLLTLLAPSEAAFKNDMFAELGNDLTMQIAAMNPISVSVDRLSSEEVSHQRAIFEAQLKELNKPQAAWVKILEGKFNKWHTEVCLVEQESIVVPKTSVKQVIKDVSSKLGGEIEVVNFIRCQVGEGIEKKQENFADEVAKLIK